MGHVGGGRFSVGDLHAASKISSANGSHLNIWDFDKSAAEFQHIHTKDARFFCCGNSAADISKGGGGGCYGIWDLRG